MNLHGMVRGLINSVNPDRTVTWKKSIGSTCDDAGKDTPLYARDILVKAQVQPMSTGDLIKSSYLTKDAGINMQVYQYKVYLYKDVEGVVRNDAKGGDLLIIDGDTYLVVAVSERWPDWCCVTANRQIDT